MLIWNSSFTRVFHVSVPCLHLDTIGQFYRECSRYLSLIGIGKLLIIYIYSHILQGPTSYYMRFRTNVFYIFTGENPCHILMKCLYIEFNVCLKLGLFSQHLLSNIFRPVCSPDLCLLWWLWEYLCSMILSLYNGKCDSLVTVDGQIMKQWHTLYVLLCFSGKTSTNSQQSWCM